MSKEGIYVCAELGVGWWGDWDVLINAVTQLASCNVDAVKLQLFDETFLESYEKSIADDLKPMILDDVQIHEVKEICEGYETDLVITPFNVNCMKRLSQFPGDTFDGLKIRAADWRNKPMRNMLKMFDVPKYISIPHEAVFNASDENRRVGDKDTLSIEMAYMGARGKDTYRIYCVPKYPPEPENLKIGNCDSAYDGASLHSDNIFDHYAAAVVNTNVQWDAGTKRRFYLEVHTYPEWEKKDNSHSAFDYDVSLGIRDVVRLKEACDRLESTIG
jgi:hypothetical protein